MSEPMPFARDTVARMHAGKTTAEQECRAHIARIDAAEPRVQAWQHLALAPALENASQIDSLSPLAGVAVGVKDVIDTALMPTGYGSAAYAGHQPAWDAPIVTRTRQAGGIILGKTVSTEFAMSSPGKTRNPANTAHTPGGSSSGSCAAVAAGMAQIAFGTQTSGSIIRPAAFCGVVGYKPSFGTLNRTAVKPLSDSLDTVGVITRDLRDAAFATAVLAERPELMPGDQWCAPRIGVFLGSRWKLASAETAAALKRTETALSHAGCTVKDVPVPDWFDALYAHHDAVMGWETPRCLAYERAMLGDRLTPTTLQFLDLLSKTTLTEYDDARRALEHRAGLLERVLDGYDALLTPAAPGEAPLGLSNTGDPVFNKVWTLLHGPCLTLPVIKGPQGLPVGIQLIGRLGADAGLLATAAFVEDALAAMPGGE
jgi:amidase